MYQIAIDGPSGAGKSTVAKALAKHLNIQYLDTGAMYRALTYRALQQSVDVANSAAVIGLLDDLKIDFNGAEVLLNGKNVTAQIRQAAVTLQVSAVSAIKEVRQYMVAEQRRIAQLRSSVLDGRDIGSVVLPNADYKFYITASDLTRAKRRHAELLAKGDNATLDGVLNDMRRRDAYDSSRQFAPLKVAEGAVVIDTTTLTVEQVVAKIVGMLGDEA